MAIYRLSAQIITRGRGRSSVAAAAYRHRTSMFEAWVGTDHSYEVRGEVAHAEVALPADAPAWAREMVARNTPDRASEALWNRVEEAAGRRDAALAQEMNIALPLELSRDEQIALARAFVAEAFTSRGRVADWVLHDKPGNPHIHVQLTLRPLTEQGFGARYEKVLDPATGEQVVSAKGNPVYRKWAGKREELVAVRQLWAEIANHHLALAGHEARIDHRSNRDRGIRLVPGRHVGPGFDAIRKREGAPHRGPAAERIRGENAAAIEADPTRLIEVLTAEKSVFDRHDVARALHLHIDDAQQFQRVLAKVMNSPELVTLIPDLPQPETGRRLDTKLRFTSRTMLRLEREMGERASRMGAARGYDVRTASVERAIASQNLRLRARDAASAGLSDEQQAAVRHVMRDAPLTAVIGLAGAGKSTMLDAARDAWERDGYRVHGAALAGKAAEELERSSGIRSRTLASWELAWGQGRDRLRRGDVLVIDEAGMVGSRQLGAVLEEVERRGAKVVLVGDAMQLQPIAAGAAFRAITERVGYLELTGIRRQRETWQREASLALAEGRTAEALHAYAGRGQVRFSATFEGARAALVEEWARAGEGAGSQLILAHRNVDVAALNHAVREARKRIGELTGEARFETARGERRFAAGDRVLFLENDRTLGVKNGMLGTVREAKPGRLRVEVDAGGLVEVDEGTYRSLDHGYAVTVHKAQGATVDRALVLASPGMDRHLAYVALTRHRESVTLHAGHDEFRTLDAMAERLGRVGAKETTLDYVGRAEFLERRGFESVRSLSPRLAEWLERSELLERGRARLEAVAGRLETAGRMVWDRVARRAAQAAPESSLARQDQGRTVEEVARDTALASPAYVQAAEATRVAAARLYDGFGAVSERLERKLTGDDFDRHLMLLTLQDHPGSLGSLRERPDQAAALAALRGAAVTQAQAYAVAYDEARGVARRIERAMSAPPRRGPMRVEPPPPALFKAVPEQATSPEQDVQAAVFARPDYRDQRRALHTRAALVYRDPEAAVARIERWFVGGESRHRVNDGLRAEPEAAGELLGSSRILDGARARAERNAALAAVPPMAAEARELGSRYQTYTAKAAEDLERRRERMAVEIPGLSGALLTELRRLDEMRRASPAAFSTGVAELGRHLALREELAAFGRAVRSRFGEHDFRGGAGAVLALVPVAEQAKLENMVPTLRMIQRVEAEQRYHASLGFNRAREQHRGLSR